jgi:hypothetical protein
MELPRRYSTRPGEADIRLVRKLGLFDDLSERVSFGDTPQECRTKARDAKQAAPSN